MQEAICHAVPSLLSAPLSALHTSAPSPAEAKGRYVLQAVSSLSLDANLQALHQRMGSANQGGTVIRAAARRG